MLVGAPPPPLPPRPLRQTCKKKIVHVITVGQSELIPERHQYRSVEAGVVLVGLVGGIMRVYSCSQAPETNFTVTYLISYTSGGEVWT